jgi:hypothetical protein
MKTEPNIPQKTTIPTDQLEIKQINEIATLTRQLLTKRYTDVNKTVLRGVHPKSHGCVNATFKINDDIEPELQVGLFGTKGKEYQALIRFSNATGLVEDDVTSTDEGIENSSRGMAIKVLAVEQGGPFLKEDNCARNQDFLMINTPAFAFANVPDYLRLNQVLVTQNDQAAGFFAPLSPNVHPVAFTDQQRATALQSAQIVGEIKSIVVANPVEAQYFGAAPFGFGPKRVMRFSAKPRVAANPQVLPTNPSADYLRQALDTRMKEDQPVVFDFMVQVRRADEDNLMMENATEHWPEADYPFINVATVTISAPQANISSKPSEDACEELVYTPWHALAVHEPLGGINRLRKKVYSTSANTRLEGRRPSCPHGNASKQR